MEMSSSFQVPAPKPKARAPVENSATEAADNAKELECSQAPPLSSASKFQEPEWAATIAPDESSMNDDDKNVGGDEQGDCKNATLASWKLEVLKGGVPLDLELSIGTKTCFVVGRQGDGACDLVLEHPSISRAHAVLQHHRNGSFWVRDLASTHGSSVNKQKCAPNEYQEVRPGDVLRFGDSQRMYIVHGPEFLRPPELESDTLAKVRKHLSGKAERKAKRDQDEATMRRYGSATIQDARAVAEAVKARQGGDVEVDGVSWGMRGEGDEETGDGDGDGGSNDGQGGAASSQAGELPDYLRRAPNKGVKVEHSSSLLDQSGGQDDGGGGGGGGGNGSDQDVSDERDRRVAKDEKLWDKLQTKVGKLNNIEEENRRIMSKEGGAEGLSEGQKGQLVRNEERIGTLTEEVAILENEIRGKNVQRIETKRKQKDGKSGKHGGSDGGSDSDGGGGGDDYLDRTSSTVDGRGAGSKRRKRGLKQLTALTASTPTTASSSSAGIIGGGGISGGGGGGGGGATKSATKSTAAAVSLPPSLLAGNGLTAEALEAEALRMNEKLASLEQEIGVLKRGQEGGEGGEGGEGEGGGDKLEEFMAANLKEQAKQQLGLLAAEAADLERHLKAVRSLLQVAAPALAGLRAKRSPARPALVGSGLSLPPPPIPAPPPAAETSTATAAAAATASDASTASSSLTALPSASLSPAASQVEIATERKSAALPAPAPRLSLPETGSTQEGEGEEEEEEKEKGDERTDNAAGGAVDTVGSTATDNAVQDGEGVGGGGSVVGSEKSGSERNKALSVPTNGGGGEGFEGAGGAGGSAKRVVKGPCAMPPPPAPSPPESSSSSASPPAASSAAATTTTTNANTTTATPDAGTGSKTMSKRKRLASQHRATLPPPADSKGGEPAAGFAKHEKKAVDKKNKDTKNSESFGGGGGGGTGNKKNPHDKKPAESEESEVSLEGGDMNWKPPQGQTGDGKTALNAKFGY